MSSPENRLRLNSLISNLELVMRKTLKICWMIVSGGNQGRIQIRKTNIE